MNNTNSRNWFKSVHRKPAMMQLPRLQRKKVLYMYAVNEIVISHHGKPRRLNCLSRCRIARARLTSRENIRQRNSNRPQQNAHKHTAAADVLCVCCVCAVSEKAVSRIPAAPMLLYCARGSRECARQYTHLYKRDQLFVLLLRHANHDDKPRRPCVVSHKCILRVCVCASACFCVCIWQRRSTVRPTLSLG